MNIDETQRATVAKWIADGLKLAEIQTRLASDLGVKLTYMEVRFLVDDLKLTPKDPEPVKPAQPIGGAQGAGTPASPLKTAPVPEATGEALPGGRVSVSVDQLARPGALVSGNVTFSDGQSADWYLDQTGRLGVVPKQQGYKPAPADVQEFQLALQNELARMGF